jgi:hypothetical protein
MSREQKPTGDRKLSTWFCWWIIAALCLLVPIGFGAVSSWVNHNLSLSVRPRLGEAQAPFMALPSVDIDSDSAVVAADGQSAEGAKTTRASGDSCPALFDLAGPVVAPSIFQLQPVSPKDSDSDTWPPATSADSATSVRGESQSSTSSPHPDPVTTIAPTRLQLPIETSQHVADIVRGAVRQAQHGALYSARSQLIKGIRAIARALDAQAGGQAHSVALAEALRAVDEADDFQFRGRQYEADVAIESFVSGHVTPVLKLAIDAGPESPGLNSLQAREEYYNFARQRLFVASGQAPVAAMAYYALGRVESKLRSSLLRNNGAPREIVLYEAALMIEPNHSLAANELGIAFVRDGQLQMAARYFQHSAQLSPSPTTLTNLAKVYERLGDQQAHRAVQQQLVAVGPRGVAPGHTAVQLVTMQEFSGSSGQPRPAHATSVFRGPVSVPAQVQVPMRGRMPQRTVPVRGAKRRPQATAASVWANFQQGN